MNQRRKDGATLALVIILAFVLIIVGGCFFVWQLLVGGGKELQHATDSGNLNVAKQALVTPDVTVPSGTNSHTQTDLRKEFSDVLDPGFKVNLLNFNRIVGKAVFAQLNAQSEGTDLAKANAAALTQAVYDLGLQLQQNLNAAAALKSQFENISNQNSVRMLQHPNAAATQQSISHKDAEYAVSYMARNKASNVYFDPSQLPPNTSLQPSDYVQKDVKGNKTFLAGYQGFSTSAGIPNCPTTWAVPLRPGEQPHLVSVDDFTSNEKAPFTPFTIPNSFRSGGQASFIRTGTDVQLRSCAIVGVLEKVFPMESSGGTIIVDNGGRQISININDKGSSIFADPTKMMAPSGVEVFTVQCAGQFPGGGSSRQFMAHYDSTKDDMLPSQKLESMASSTQTSDSFSPSVPAPYSTMRRWNDEATAINSDDDSNSDYWALKMLNQTRYHSRFDSRNMIMSGTTSPPGAPGQTLGGKTTWISNSFVCNNQAFMSGDGTAQPADCGKTDRFEKLFNGTFGGGSGSTSYDHLMTLEQYILEIEGGFGGGAGCFMAHNYAPLGGCVGNSSYGSGMKHVTYPPEALDPSDPDATGIFNTGTLEQLLGDTNAPGSIRNDVERRLQQIAPGKDSSQIFQTKVKFNRVMYIHKDANGSLVMDTNKPANLQYDLESDPSYLRPVIHNGIPDGDPDNPNNNGMKPIDISGNFVGASLWECGDGKQSGRSASYVRWYPSSGKGGLLGVIKFVNCPEADGPAWCCP